MYILQSYFLLCKLYSIFIEEKWGNGLKWINYSMKQTTAKSNFLNITPNNTVQEKYRF